MVGKSLLRFAIDDGPLAIFDLNRVCSRGSNTTNSRCIAMIDRGWKFYPAPKLAIPFAVGITASDALDLSPLALLLPLALSLGWLVFALRFERGSPMLALLASVALAGALEYAVAVRSSLEWMAGSRIERAELVGRVATAVERKERRFEVIVEVDSVLYRNSVASPDARVLLTLFEPPAITLEVGDHISVVGSIAVPTRPANPGEIDYAAYLRSLDVAATMTAERAASLLLIRRDDPGIVDRLVVPARKLARRFADSLVGEDAGGVVRALLLGERGGIDADTREAFVRTGTIHVLAVSGLHVAVIALALFVVVSWIPSRSWQLPVYVAALLYYTLVVGSGASIVRAVVMAIVILACRLAGRTPRPLNTLGVAALVVLMLRPESLFELGFQLSFASVGGIIVVAPPLRAWVRERRYLQGGVARAICDGLIMTTSAQLFTLPFMLHHFGAISPVSLLVNIVVVPLGSIALGAAAAGTILSALSDMAAGPFASAATLSVRAMTEIATWSAGLQFATLSVGTIAPVAAVVLFVAIVWLALAGSVRDVLVRLAITAMVLVSMPGLEQLFDPLADGDYLCALRSTDGIIPAVVARDTVRLYYSSDDSARAARAGEALRRRLGSRELRVLSFDSAVSASELLVVNEDPREYMHREMRVLLSTTAQRPVGLIHAYGDTLLQLPLGRRLESAIAVRRADRWEVVRWR